MKTNYYSDLKFEKLENGFKHNKEDDFACFALWKIARPYRDKIRSLFLSHFEILLETEIQWSEKYFHSNASRLYEEPIFSNLSPGEHRSVHGNKIGDTKFILFIVKDNKPDYTYSRSVSGKIEMSNLNIVNAKYQIRDWIERDTGAKYGIHSTNNIYEFFFQVPLLLGVPKFKQIMENKKITCSYIEKDLEGANGWVDYFQFFEILNFTSNYLVQRGFEALPQNNPEKDVDFITDNLQRIASATGMKQKKDQLYKGKIIIENEEVSIDIRFIGDKYYDNVWSKEMLDTKIMRNGIFVPREDFYFFSLLYHAKVQKSEVKEKYIDILNNLAKRLRFNWFQTELLKNDEFIGKLLKGYFESNHYFYEDPIDEGVGKNQNVISYLPTLERHVSLVSKKGKVYSTMKNLLPQSALSFLKKVRN